jgi:hypothetical protein
MTTRNAAVLTPAPRWPPAWRREPRSWLRCVVCKVPHRFEDMVDTGHDRFVCRPEIASELCARLQAAA